MQSCNNFFESDLYSRLDWTFFSHSCKVVFFFSQNVLKYRYYQQLHPWSPCLFDMEDLTKKKNNP